MDIDTKNAEQRLYMAAAGSILVALGSWVCCFVGPVAGIVVGMLTRRQVRWYRALMEPDEFPAGAARIANVAGAFAVVVSVLELVVLLAVRFWG